MNAISPDSCKSKIQKKIAKIGKKRSAEANRHEEVMDKINAELALVQKECRHDIGLGGYCMICGWMSY